MPDNPPRLIVRDGSGNERQVEIAHTPFSMGRQGDNDLVVLDARVSRQHARILQDGQTYLLEDTGSRHGTFVNGERISSCPLASGAQIMLGVADSYQIIFITEEAGIPKLLAELGRLGEGPAPQLQHLGLLLQVAQMMHRAPALEEVLTALVDAAVQLGGADRGLLFLRDDAGDLHLRLARGQGGVYLPATLTDYSREVVERVAQAGREEVVLEEVGSGRSTGETAILQGAMRGVLAVPLQKLPLTEASGETIQPTRAELLGVLYLESCMRPTALTSLDRQVLQTLAVEGATIIENARLFRVSREQERLRHEFGLARNIQQNLLPRELPQGELFTLRAITMPSQAVGGDYYDVIRLPLGRFGFTVADVSGKGLPAAILAASLQGAFAAVASGNPGLDELFRRVNDFLCDRTAPEMFATMFYGVLDPHGEFTFVNAAHTPPLVVRTNGAINRLDSSNFPLGFFSGAAFEVRSLQLEFGDQVVIYSDGVTEARDAQGEFFGETRLKTLLEACAVQAGEAVCDKVMATVQEFVGAAPQADDLTLMVLRFGPPPAQS